MFLYNVGIELAKLSLRTVWTVRSLQDKLLSSRPKIHRFVMGQRDALQAVQEEMKDNQKEVYWFHAASYGEYNVIRPIVKKMRQENRQVVVTFFSPTGYEILSEENKKTQEVDHVFYLPLDTPSNVRHFLDALHPDKAIFAISEYWINYLTELKKRRISTYLVSMIVSKDSYLLKWHGFPIRKALKAIKTFMVLDEESKQNLASVGFNNVVVTGDPLFDNAISISKEDYHNELIERFCDGDRPVLVAGSISDKNDLDLTAALANSYKDVKLLVVPHEINEEELRNITDKMEGKTLLYSECTPDTDLSNVQVLVIDFVGSLARIYRYGSWAYVGGGFTPYLHSIIEPVVYGIPVSFGPRIERKKTPYQLLKMGIGTLVESEADILAWFDNVKDKQTLTDIRRKAIQFTDASANATNKVIQIISE